MDLIRMSIEAITKNSPARSYRLNEKWMLQTGISYDSSAVDTKDRIAALPIDEQRRFGIGAIHKWTDTIQLSMAFQWTHLGDARLNNSVIKGKYDQNDVFLFSFSINWSKLPWSGKGTF